ncbi:MAG: ABC-F family ATP-binding cassette domain-containing protein [Saprospiraceae bacterium]|nr:ABC-F family ATP-binding cassette domain-containing protein [Saprospiraceae bacterium]MBP6567552.1 ABC-F family ATP-binding cassette domain-containing protein [Saprospiraceae bacterium]
MYYVRDISVKYGERSLLDEISFMISPKERIGLIGRNGAGKSTLLKIIAGQARPDEGALEFPTKTTVGYLRQEFELNETQTVLDETMSCHEEALELQKQLDDINAELMTREDYESTSYSKMLEELAGLTGRLEHFDLSALEVETVKILKGLGFSDKDFGRRVSEFSGGWKMRIELSKLLLRKPDLLMLDEPTNHLDIESIIWLENYLIDYPGTVIVISHDIQFLENVCNRIIEVELGGIIDYKLKYSKFLEEKEKQKTIQIAAFENQQKDIAQKEKTINRFMAKATKTKMAQSMQKQLDKVERIEVPAEITKAMTIRFAEVPRSGRDVVRTVDVSKSFDNKPVFKNINITIERGDRVAFVGQNGQGKTTMAKIISGLLPATSGKVEEGSNMHLSYYAQNQSELLDLKSTVMQVMEDKAPEEMRSRVRNILGSFLFSGDDAEKKVSVLSGGERARLAMASLIMRPCNFLILDEPTNHLDIYSKEILKNALKEYTGTLLVISHDREFLSDLTNKVIEFKDGSTKEYLGDIEYFLGKKKMDNMRSVELQKSESSENSAAKIITDVKKMDTEDVRKIKKQINIAERDIAKLENEIGLLELKLSDPNFYTDPHFTEVNKKYKTLQDSLEAKMLEWENLSFEIEGM